MALAGERATSYARFVATSVDLASSAVETADRVAALSDPVRLAIVGVLAGGEHCVCDLHDRVPVAANLLSYHLRVLREAGLVRTRRRGRWIDYRLDGEGFNALWQALSAAGAPLPGQTVATGRGGRDCVDEEVGR